MRGGSSSKTAVQVGEKNGPYKNSNSKRLIVDPDELKKLGNEEYKKGNYTEALNYYDRAIVISPGNAAYRCNRSAVLICLNRLSDAVKECDEAINLDSGYVRAHHRLGSLLIRLRSSLWLQFKPHQIAARAAYLAARSLNMDLTSCHNLARVLHTTICTQGCTHCGTRSTDTPMMRQGPAGPRALFLF